AGALAVPRVVRGWPASKTSVPFWYSARPDVIIIALGEHQEAHADPIVDGWRKSGAENRPMTGEYAEDVAIEDKLAQLGEPTAEFAVRGLRMLRNLVVGTGLLV